MSESGLTEPVTYDGKAVLGMTVGICSLVALPVPLLSLILAATAIVVTLQSRQALRRDPSLAGARFGLLGFLAAVVAFAMVAGPFLISVLLHLSASSR